jgi:hypothetical protein
VYVWPTDQCPSQAEAVHAASFAPLLAALGATLLGDLVSAAIGVPAGALSKAAADDKTGFSLSGSNARYYFSTGLPAGKLGDKDAQQRAPGCYIVALTQPVDGGLENHGAKTLGSTAVPPGRARKEERKRWQLYPYVISISQMGPKLRTSNSP